MQSPPSDGPIRAGHKSKVIEAGMGGGRHKQLGLGIVDARPSSPTGWPDGYRCPSCHGDPPCRPGHHHQQEGALGRTARRVLLDPGGGVMDFLNPTGCNSAVLAPLSPDGSRFALRGLSDKTAENGRLNTAPSPAYFATVSSTRGRISAPGAFLSAAEAGAQSWRDDGPPPRSDVSRRRR